MTELELLQEKHRMGAIQMREKVKERKHRTRRLIQRGAILEKELGKIWPVEHMADASLSLFLQKLFEEPRARELLETGEDEPSPFQYGIAHLYTLLVLGCPAVGSLAKSREVIAWQSFI